MSSIDLLLAIGRCEALDRPVSCPGAPPRDMCAYPEAPWTPAECAALYRYSQLYYVSFDQLRANAIAMRCTQKFRLAYPHIKIPET